MLGLGAPGPYIAAQVDRPLKIRIPFCPLYLLNIAFDYSFGDTSRQVAQFAKLLFIIACMIFPSFAGADTLRSQGTAQPIAIADVPAEALAQVNSSLYEAAEINIGGTRFFILTRLSGGLGRERLVNAIFNAWPRWSQLMVFSVPEVTVIDYDQYIGGGPIGSSFVSINFGGDFDSFAAKILNQMTGWPALPNTMAYIQLHYGQFPDPIQAYTDDMVIHELGHLIFGWRITKIPNERLNQWFALGLGIVYDRIVWDKIHNHESPLFSSIISVWRTKFKDRTDVDQRLINPDTTNDAKLDLIRLQTYEHGKASVYLQTLRARIGPNRFDDLVQMYISRPIGSWIEYDDFLSYMTDGERIIVKDLERKFTIR